MSTFGPFTILEALLYACLFLSRETILVQGPTTLLLSGASGATLGRCRDVANIFLQNHRLSRLTYHTSISIVPRVSLFASSRNMCCPQLKPPSS